METSTRLWARENGDFAHCSLPLLMLLCKKSEPIVRVSIFNPKDLQKISGSPFSTFRRLQPNFSSVINLENSEEKRCESQNGRHPGSDNILRPGLYILRHRIGRLLVTGQWIKDENLTIHSKPIFQYR